MLYVSGEDGAESTGPSTDLQGEEGDCVDEDGPISPGDRGCDANLVTKEDEDNEGSDNADDDEEESAQPLNASPTAISNRLNPLSLRDAPSDR